MTDEKLVFLAGERAFKKIRSRGLSPGDVTVVAGAAGGPKWLILKHLDHALFGHWFNRRNKLLFLIGSSIGSWRFAAASCKDAISAIDRLEDGYIHQSYSGRPTHKEVSETSLAIIDHALGETGDVDILRHKTHRLNFFAAKGRHFLSSKNQKKLALGLAGAVMANAIRRESLKWFFKQTLFTDPRTRSPFYGRDNDAIIRARLDPKNVKKALLASGSIPYVMEGVSDIPGAEKGVYLDGGAVDYHLDIPYGLGGNGIVLFPHYAGRIIPGWFDKHLPWRKPRPSNMADVLMIAPSNAFLSRLPHGKISDRTDFYQFAGDDKGRFAYWNKVSDAGRALADDFMDAVTSQSIRKRVRPLTTAKR